MIGQTIAQYQVVKEIGRGGMGEVYLAEDTKLDRFVALKFLSLEMERDKDRIKRFLREAKLASALRHPGIVHIYEIGEWEGHHYIVMEYVEGETLSSHIKKGAIPIVEFIEIAIQIADILDEAHSKGIIHRDIKPSNILLAPRKQVKILDFGIAKLTQPPPSDTASGIPTASITESGVVFGTLPYMSPEQSLGRKADHRTDLFSTGVVFYEMATGRRPFEGTSSAELVDHILHAQPEAISRYNYDIPPELDRIIRKSLEKDPDLRYQSARDLEIDLKHLQRGSESFDITSPKRAFKRTAIITVVLLVVALSSGIFLFRDKFARVPHKDRIVLAVLPFTVLTPQQDLDYLSVGIVDAVITRLANIKRLKLCPTSMILKYSGKNADPVKAGRALGADQVLMGTIQKANERFRVSVQLAQAKDAAPTWAKQFDFATQDLLSLEDAVAQEVTAALRIQLSSSEHQRVYRRYTENAAAYEWYLRGRAQLSRYNREGTLAAIDAFEEALRQDANYALARAGLAIANAEMQLRYAPSSEGKQWGKRAKEEAEAALRSDSNLAEAHEALAAVFRYSEFNWYNTIQESRLALELNPTLDLPHYYLGAAYYHLGLLELSKREAQEGMEISEANKADGLRILGVTALLNGKPVEAVENLEKVSRLVDKPVSDPYLALAYYYSGDSERAIRMFQELLSSSSASALARSRSALASILAAQGKKEEARELLNMVNASAYLDHHVSYNMGSAYAQLEKSEKRGNGCSALPKRDSLAIHSMRQIQCWIQSEMSLNSKLC